MPTYGTSRDYSSSTSSATPAATTTSLQGELPPLVVAGLLQHECKLSVVNFGVRKAASYPQPLPSKEQLLLVTGLRSFLARPVFSSDEHGADKHKMERFLHEGRWERRLGEGGVWCVGRLGMRQSG